MATLEEHRATWQYWHLWAETQRQLRGAAIDPADTLQTWPSAVWRRRSPAPSDSRRSTTRTAAGASLRRTDGGVSVHRRRQRPLHLRPRSSRREQRLLAAATARDGQARHPAAVDLGPGRGGGWRHRRWTPARSRWCGPLATDPRRLQLVIAPAGAGKTTALRVLADTWTAGGGHILGLTPPPPPAAQLAEATGIHADTLARLTWAINRQLPAPDWAEHIGLTTLLLIDEAGMADTPTLDAESPTSSTGADGCA